MPTREIQPYKDLEYKQFIDILKSRTVPHWVQVAEILGVDENTVRSWKQTPEAQAAIIEGMEYALERMESSGQRDWRMWHEKVKLLGLIAIQKHDVESGGKPLQAIEVDISPALAKSLEDYHANHLSPADDQGHPPRSDGDQVV